MSNNNMQNIAKELLEVVNHFERNGFSRIQSIELTKIVVEKEKVNAIREHAEATKYNLN